MTKSVRFVAFYLPQFHPIPQNDEWWGPGFTEWRNVVAARPLFPGHAQPDLPGELGFYDLRLPEVRAAQAELARGHLVDAFCYYHYWFGGRRVLERPFEEVLSTGEPDHPFLLCWANESWTRNWDGRSGTILLPQRHSDDDDRDHIRALLPAFADERYLRLRGQRVFLVYRASLLPDPKRTTDAWREEVAKAGLGELHLGRVESLVQERGDPRALGFDAAVEFQPDWLALGAPGRAMLRMLARGGLRRLAARDCLYAYKDVAARMMSRPEPGYPRHPGVTPMWDNTARRQREAVVLHGSTPDRYATWLDNAARRAAGGDGLVFVNAWNEWAEGCHLEPNARWGRAYLEAHARVAGSHR